ncbi:MAG: RlmE family RNA methyltransferase [Candidatus Lernaella stagnicola]|nr:RlmE family RNA methyltransferase [Candidatus Lernaella stagnicola]
MRLRLDKRRRGDAKQIGKAKSGKPTSGDPRWDHFAQRAKDEGYASRAVYKLAEIDRRVSLFVPGARVLDLGCAPGGWLQYAAQKVTASGRVVGIDLRPTDVQAPQVRTIVGDLLEGVDLGEETKPFDVVLSDMAPDTTGVRNVDQARSAELARLAFQWALRLGAPGSAFVTKIFQGPDFEALLRDVKDAYEKVRCVRPEATRKESIEVFIVALKKKAL